MDIKKALTFFVGLLLFGLAMEYFYSLSDGNSFQFPLRKIGIYAVIAVIYGFWKGREKADT